MLLGDPGSYLLMWASPGAALLRHAHPVPAGIVSPRGGGDVPATLRGVEAELAGSALARPASWLSAHKTCARTRRPSSAGPGEATPKVRGAQDRGLRLQPLPNPSWGSGPPSDGEG